MPSLLEPHVASGPLARDEGSLTLVTWVQGASANWLVLRYLYALLGGGGKAAEDEEGGVPGVVLVSFLRDAKFWADGCARLGMDLDALRKSGRFSFVDGLTGGGGLYATPHAPSAGDGVIAGSVGQVGAVKTQVEAAVARLYAAAGRRKMLIMDGLDVLVAMTPPGSASETESLLMSLRENVYSTLITLAADEPLMQAAVHQQHQQQQQGAKMTTSLEREQAALVVGQAHAADQVVSLRRLDTGAAADVSGVLRVATSRGNGGGADEGEELLYHVSGDGSVRVFERGA
ncbi:hypothetical protein NLG97_g8694 [Lecanicillium saksenae]|uniref:Uncharacterized protein n=1 Tax=Lecanicillium saksenae TaxID=468837 RepID=A0ACC1QIB7_9HYPO|nr:hypothetical protein NLG97_g8694 [Lecanicillium saksenae]